jgi:protein-disulfide isomerase
MIGLRRAIKNKNRAMTNRRLSLLVGLLFFVLLWASPLQAQQPSTVQAQQPSTDELRKEIQALTESVKQMQKDLQEIKALLVGRAPAAPPEKVVLDLSNKPSQGEATAKLTLIEFSDYQCPFCGRHARDTAPQIDKEYVTTGKLRHVFVDYPLETMHKFAFKSAEAARCAGEQGKYWEMHARLFENQNKLDSLTPYAEAIGLNVPKFEECLNSGRQAAAIRQDMAEAQAAGVNSTPTFFLAYTDPKTSKIKTVRRLTGAQPYAAFKAEIDKLLAGGPEAPAPKGGQK